MKRLIVFIYLLVGQYFSLALSTPGGLTSIAFAGDDVSLLIRQAKEAGVPESAVAAIVKKAQARGLTEDSLESLVKVAVDAGHRGLYLAPILDKIQEGLAKNAQPDVIERVSRRIMSRVAEAEESLEGFLPSFPHKHMVIDAALEARERGVSAAGVREIFSAASSRKDLLSRDPGRIIEALDGTAGLVDMGIDEDKASDLMKEAVSHGYGKEEIRGLSVELTHNLGFLGRRERAEALSSTLDMVKEGRGIQRIRESLRSHTAIPGKTLGSGEGLPPSERGKEGIGPNESEREHQIPRPAPREKNRGKKGN